MKSDLDIPKMYLYTKMNFLSRLSKLLAQTGQTHKQTDTT